MHQYASQKKISGGWEELLPHYISFICLNTNGVKNVEFGKTSENMLGTMLYPKQDCVGWQLGRGRQETAASSHIKLISCHKFSITVIFLTSMSWKLQTLTHITSSKVRYWDYYWASWSAMLPIWVRKVDITNKMKSNNGNMQNVLGLFKTTLLFWEQFIMYKSLKAFSSLMAHLFFFSSFRICYWDCCRIFLIHLYMLIFQIFFEHLIVKISFYF